jgi:hypothetical protein
MALEIYPADKLWDLVTHGGLNLSTAELRVRLLSSSFAPTITTGSDDVDYLMDTIWDTGGDDASDPSFNEVATGNGYTTGGIQLANFSASGSIITFDDVTWTSLTKTFRWAVGVAIGTFGGYVDPLIFAILPDATPADIISNGSDWSILWNESEGVFYR